MHFVIQKRPTLDILLNFAMTSLITSDNNCSLGWKIKTEVKPVYFAAKSQQRCILFLIVDTGSLSKNDFFQKCE